MRMGQGVRAGLGHGGITSVLQTQFSSLFNFIFFVVIFTVQSQHYCLYSDSPTLLLLMMPRPPAPSAL